MKRRSFLKIIGVLGAAGFCLKYSPLFSMTQDLFICFMDVSRYLTGQKDLDIKTGEKYFQILTQREENKGKIADLYLYTRQKEKIPDDRPDLKKFSQEILTLWYTGIITENGEEKMIDYFGSLTWETLDFTKPQGLCG